jgi:bifunctional ADP-heptose synthase (sugar kinase/adenylyltransferase)
MEEGFDPAGAGDAVAARLTCALEAGPGTGRFAACTGGRGSVEQGRRNTNHAKDTNGYA